MWIILMAFLINNQPVAIFTNKDLQFDSQAACEMHIDQAVADLKKELEKDMVPVLTPLLGKGTFEGKCTHDPSKPKEHNI